MTFAEFFTRYWVQIVVPFIAIVGSLLFYSFSPSDTRRKFTKVIPLIISVCVWITLRDFAGLLRSWRWLDVVFMVFVALYCLSYLFMYKEKYETMGYVIAEGCKGCYYTPPLKIGKYTVFNVGSSCKTFPNEKGEITLVVPTCLITWYGPIASCNVLVTRRKIVKIPTYIRNSIQGNKNYNLDNIWYGRFDKATLLYGKAIYRNLDDKKINPAEVQEELLNAYQVGNTNQSFLDKDTRAIEDYASSLDRVGQTLNKKSRIISERRDIPDEHGT